jgi:TolB-like protein
MNEVDQEAGAVRRQLEGILASSGFAKKDRLSRFLRFVVERKLAGRAHELKETVIGFEVFERQADYNPKKDAIVRTEAGRLRARLAEYYSGEGKSDSLVIELPRGGYVPIFRKADSAIPTEPSSTNHGRLWIGAGAALGCVVISVAGLIAWRTERKNAPVTIAVLPLDNLNHDPADDYLADGLTDELIRDLSTYEGLAPRSRTSSFALKGKSRNIREAGKELAADYIVEGSVLRAADRLRITAQLIRTRDDFPMWSGKFDREASDVLAIQDEISRAIVNNLRVKLGRGRRRYETSAEAYDLYLRARAAGLRDSVGLFQQAIAKDPSFALAYAGLASSYAYRTGNTFNDSDGELPKMRAAAERAIEVDPLLAEAHSAVGKAYARDGQWALSEASFRRAIEIDRNRSESYGDFAVYVLMQQGRIREALHEMRVAQRSDPLSAEVRSQLAYVLLSSHLYDEAASECEKLPEDCRCWPAPSEPVRYECLGRARMGQGRFREAVEILAAGIAKGVPIGAPIRGYLGYAYGRVGRHDEAEKIVELASPFPYHQAVALIGMGDRDRAIAALEKMVPTGPVRVGLALAVPELDAVRDDPRLKDLRREVGLPQ